MGIPKATLRRNGSQMITIRLEYVVGIQDVVNAIHHKLIYETSEGVAKYLAALTRRTAFDAVRDMLRDRGEFWFPEGPDVDSQDAAVIARAHALFPELLGRWAQP